MRLDNSSKNEKPALDETIHAACELIVEILKSSDYKLDYTLESMKEVDRFIDDESGEDGIILSLGGRIMFALGCYVGETVIRLYGGKWHTDDNDPKGDANASVTLDNGMVIFPGINVVKRCVNGSEDSIYAYVRALSLDKTKRTVPPPYDKILEKTVLMFSRAGMKADYTLESLKDIDRFIDEESGEDGVISIDVNGLFGVGLYVGETVIHLYGGEWRPEDNDPQGEITASVKLDDGEVVLPMQMVAKRHSGSTYSIYDYVRAFSPDKAQNKKPTLDEDIHGACKWVVTALNSSGYKADYTLESMKEIDRFIDEQSGENGIISRNRGSIIFSLGCYVGETVIRLYGGKWHTDDSDPQGEINASVELENGTVIFPVQRVIERYRNGSEDGIYAYVYVLSPDKAAL
ncbi:MAG: hypothetical protein NC395_02520 [Prevotella sp.]|nr:hypothetical protein [Prevotella sp.]